MGTTSSTSGGARATTVEALKFILRQIGRFYNSSSLVGDKPFYEVESFPWVEKIEANWQVIREELDELLKYREHLPNFQDISPDQKGLSQDDHWKTFFFYAYGIKAGNDSDSCPRTLELLHQIPGMKTAFFSIFGPGKHLPPHRGPYNGVLRYHLGLKVPEPRDQCGIRVQDEVRHWEEGKSLIFDDTYLHEAWNHTDQDRVVLFVDFVRPMTFPASMMNSALIQIIGLSPFVLGAKGNYTAWEERFERIVND
ncbi:MAG: aspartyl/asparaginyl beta-hydroxylase domain-containing protein [Truepera sp.]|nr:aspartyl/asparaginyl beta-hydroxylase domain-containing protein [Truepera sp.]